MPLDLQARLLAYHDSLGNEASRALIKDAMTENTRAGFAASALVEALKALWLATACGTDDERLSALTAAGDLLASIGALDALQDAEAAAAMRGTA